MQKTPSLALCRLWCLQCRRRRVGHSRTRHGRADLRCRKLEGLPLRPSKLGTVAASAWHWIELGWAIDRGEQGSVTVTHGEVNVQFSRHNVVGSVVFPS